MELRGHHVVIGLLVLGVGAAGFASWYQWSMTDRVLAFWGPEVATTLRSPEKVELLELGPEGSEGPGSVLTLTVDGRVFPIESRRDVTAAPGLSHARQALLENASFNFDAPPTAEPARWSHALIVSRGPKEATILFDFTSHRLRLLAAPREVVLGERLDPRDPKKAKEKGLPVFFRGLAEK
jgi:hypothetical protein